MKFGKPEDIKIHLQVLLGEAVVTIKDIAEFTEGSIIELDKNAGEPMDLIAAGKKIAQGEVVVIDEKFGIRLTKIIDREEE